MVVEDDTYGEEVVDFLEGDALELHLAPDGEASLDSGLHLIAQPHAVEAELQWGSEALEEGFTPRLRLLDFAEDLLVGLGVLIAEA